MSARNYKRQAPVFAALGDETRLRILNLLSRGQLPVADIIAAMDAPQARISQQLDVGVGPALPQETDGAQARIGGQTFP